MARGNQRRVRERNGSHIITIPSAFVAQMGLEDGTMMEITLGSLNYRECIILEIAEADDGAE